VLHLVDKTQCIGLCNLKLIDFKEKSKKELDICLQLRNEFLEKARILAPKIIHNRIMFQKLCKEIIETAKDNNLLDKNNKLEYSFHLNEYFDEGVEILKIKNGKLSIEHKLNLAKDIDWNIEKDEIKHNITEQIKIKIKQSRTDVINDFIDKLCKELKIRPVRFSIEDNLKQLYDFSSGKIYKYIKLENTRISQCFRRDFTSAIYTINYLTICPNSPGKINIDLGNYHFFKFLKKQTIDNNEYAVYESRIDGGKILLHIFENGYRLNGHRRRKILREIGYKRNKFQKK
jgi:hypothetical protein